MRSLVFSTLLVFVTLMQSGIAQAAIDARPLESDPRLVVFPYDENNSYRIFARPLSVTHIVLEKDERIRALAIGDLTNWETVKKDNHLFIKPKANMVQTSGTMITNKRAYQLFFISTTSETGKWFQRVAWDYPGSMALVEETEDQEDALQQMTTDPARRSFNRSAESLESSARTTQPVDDSNVIDPASFGFDYETVGEASFKPITVYDNGRSTFLKLPSDAPIPALFEVVDGEMQLLDYTFRNGVLVVPKLINVSVLKLGQREVKVYSTKRMRRTFFGGEFVERSK